MTTLRQRVHAVEQTARRRLLLHGAAWFCVWVLAAMVLCGLGDYLLRWKELGLRILASSAVAGVAAWAYWRFLHPLLQRRLDDLETARRIERRFPQLRDQLSSALLFADQPERDPQCGSADLRRAVLAEVSARTAELDFREALDPALPRVTRRTIALCLLLAAAPLLWNAAATGRAAVRLLAPWAPVTWPLKTRLEIDAPDRIARGSDFVVRIAVRGERPPQVVISYRDDHGGAVRRYPLDDRGEQFTHRLNNVVDDFQFRVEGGDDVDGPWRNVEVAPAAQVERWELRVTPPAYSGRGAEVLTDHGEVLEGSVVSAAGVADRPVRSAVLRCEPPDMFQPLTAAAGPAEADAGDTRDPIDSNADAGAFPLVLDSQRASFSSRSALTVHRSGRYWIELTDRATGVVASTEPRMLRRREDAAPTLAWEAPADQLVVSPVAAIQIAASAKDDLAIQSVRLEFHTQSAAGEQNGVLPLFTGPETPPPSSPQSAGEQQRIEQTWELAPLNLGPRVDIQLRLVVADYAGQETAAKWRSLRVLDGADLRDWVLQQQAVILARLQQALRSQLQARSQVAAVAQVAREDAARPDDRQVDRLQSGEVIQRSVRSLLDPPAGAQRLIADLLQDMDANRLQDEEAAARLNRWSQTLAGLSRGALTEAEDALQASLQDARQDDASPGNSALLDWLSRTDRAQADVIQTLEQLLEDAQQWDAQQRLSSELGKTLAEQKQLAEASTELRMRTLGVDPQQWSSEQRLQGAELAERQDALARTLRNQIDRLEEAIQNLFDSASPENASPREQGDQARLERTWQQLRESALDGRMRNAAKELRQRLPGPAAESQQAIAQDLQQTLDALAGRAPAAAGRSDSSSSSGSPGGEPALRRDLTDALRQQEAVAAATAELAERGEQLSVEARDLQAARQGAEQQAVAARVQGMRESQPPGSLREFALESIRRAAADAGQRLLRHQPDEQTRRQQQAASDGLRRLLDQLPREGNASPPGSPPAEQDVAAAPQKPSGPSLQDLQLLRFLQQQLRQETQQADAGGESAADLMLDLSRRQGRLSQLARELAQPSDAAASPEPDPMRAPPDLEKSLDDLFEIR